MTQQQQQQQHDRNSCFSNPPPPFTMCSRQEWDARQVSGEISLLERSAVAVATAAPNTTTTTPAPSTSLQRALQKQQQQSRQTNDNNNKKHNNNNNQTYKLRMDPRFAVTKYRRSAAAGGSSITMERRRPPPRSLAQLEMTVHYLQHLLVTAPTVAPDHTTRIDSYIHIVVAFVQDRLRAVQVDLVLLQADEATAVAEAKAVTEAKASAHPTTTTTTTSSSSARPIRSTIKRKRLQYHMARTQILILYLLADCPQYSQKLGRDALQTALSNYWNEQEQEQQHDDDDDDDDDEMLSFMLLQSMLPTIFSSDRNGGGSSSSTTATASMSFVQLYRRHHHYCRQRHVTDGTVRGKMLERESSWPLFQWTLRLVTLLQTGLWQAALHQLHTVSTPQSRSSNKHNEDNDDDDDDDILSCHQRTLAFNVLVKCQLAPFLAQIRWNALQSYNFSWGKGEAVLASEVARLLCFSQLGKHTTATSAAARKSPWDDNSPNEETKDKEQYRHMNPAVSAASAASAALAFCQNIGLPVETDSNNIEESNVRFKVTPLQPLPPDTLMRNDDFVLWQLERTMVTENNNQNFRRVDASGLELPPQSWMELVLWRGGRPKQQREKLQHEHIYE